MTESTGDLGRDRWNEYIRKQERQERFGQFLKRQAEYLASGQRDQRWDILPGQEETLAWHFTAWEKELGPLFRNYLDEWYERIWGA